MSYVTVVARTAAVDTHTHTHTHTHLAGTDDLLSYSSPQVHLFMRYTCDSYNYDVFDYDSNALLPFNHCAKKVKKVKLAHLI